MKYADQYKSTEDENRKTHSQFSYLMPTKKKKKKEKHFLICLCLRLN